METRDDPIGAREHVVGKVEPATLKHVDLDPLEHNDRRRPLGGERLIEPVDPIPLLEEPRSIEPVGHRDTLAMIGDRDILEASLPRAADHLDKRVLTVGVGGVHVEIATDLLLLEKEGEPPLGRKQDLVAPLTQFRGNPGESEGPVDLGLGRRRRGRCRGDGPDRLEAIFVERPAPLARPRTEADVVLLRAGEVLPGGPEGGRPNDPEIELEAARPTDARLRRARHDSLHRMGPPPEVLHHRHGVGRHGDKIDVADRLAPPPPTPGRLDPLDSRTDAHPGDNVGDNLIGFLPELPRHGSAPHEGDVLEDHGFRLFAKPLHPAHRCGAAGRLEAIERINPQGIDQQADLLRPEPGHPQQIEDPDRNPGRQLLEERKFAGVEDRLDLGGEIPPDAVEVGEGSCFVPADRFEGIDLIGDGPGRGAVGADPERVLPVVFEEFGEAIEEGGDVGVVQGGSRWNEPHQLTAADATAGLRWDRGSDGAQPAAMTWCGPSARGVAGRPRWSFPARAPGPSACRESFHGGKGRQVPAGSERVAGHQPGGQHPR